MKRPKKPEIPKRSCKVEGQFLCDNNLEALINLAEREKLQYKDVFVQLEDCNEFDLINYDWDLKINVFYRKFESEKDYNKKMEDYNKKMEDYNKKMEEYKRWKEEHAEEEKEKKLKSLINKEKCLERELEKIKKLKENI